MKRTSFTKLPVSQSVSQKFPVSKDPPHPPPPQKKNETHNTKSGSRFLCCIRSPNKVRSANLLQRFMTKICTHFSFPHFSFFSREFAVRSFSNSQCVHSTIRSLFIQQFAVRSFSNSQRVPSAIRSAFLQQFAARSFSNSQCVPSAIRSAFLQHSSNTK